MEREGLRGRDIERWGERDGGSEGARERERVKGKDMAVK